VRKWEEAAQIPLYDRTFPTLGLEFALLLRFCFIPSAFPCQFPELRMRRIKWNWFPIISVARWGAKGPCPQKNFRNIVILCFKRRYPKQNSVIFLKSSAFAHPYFFGSSKIFGLTTLLFPIKEFTDWLDCVMFAETSSQMRSQKFWRRGGKQQLSLNIWIFIFSPCF